MFVQTAAAQELSPVGRPSPDPAVRPCLQHGTLAQRSDPVESRDIFEFMCPHNRPPDYYAQIQAALLRRGYLDSTQLVRAPVTLGHYMITGLTAFQRDNNLPQVYWEIPMETLRALGIEPVPHQDGATAEQQLSTMRVRKRKARSRN